MLLGTDVQYMYMGGRSGSGLLRMNSRWLYTCLIRLTLPVLWNILVGGFRRNEREVPKVICSLAADEGKVLRLGCSWVHREQKSRIASTAIVERIISVSHMRLTCRGGAYKSFFASSVPSGPLANRSRSSIALPRPSIKPLNVWRRQWSLHA